MKKKKNYKLYISIVMLTIIALVSGALPVLKHISMNRGDYVSHIRFIGLLFTEQNVISYPIWHLLVMFLGKWIGQNSAAVVVTSLFNLLTAYVVFIIMRKITAISEIEAGIYTSMIILCGPLYIPAINKYYYLGQFTGNTWHNPTNIAVKAVAVVLTYMMYKCIYEYKQIQGKKYYIIISVLLVISALLKPTYVQVAFPTLALVYACQILTRKIDWKSMWKLFCTTLPTGCVIIYQLLSMYGEGGSRGVKGAGLSISLFEWWKLWSTNLLGSFLISFAFPLLLIICRGKAYWKNKRNIFILVFFLVGFLEFALLYEGKAGNFCWGVLLATFIVFFNSVIELFEWRTEWRGMENNKEKYKWIACQLLFIAHAAYGIAYWIWLTLSGTTSQC